MTLINKYQTVKQFKKSGQFLQLRADLKMTLDFALFQSHSVLVCWFSGKNGIFELFSVKKSTILLSDWFDLM